MSPRERFLKGEYAKIVEEFEASGLKPSRTPKAQQAWLAASFALLGRIEEALLWPSSQDAIVRFYITVALVRASRYEEADQALAELIQAARAKNRSHEARFFCAQALGFRAFFEGRFRKAHFWSRLAKKEAILSGDLHERVLSSDLSGHSLLQMGRVDEGLESLGEALKIAKRAGNLSNITALRAAIAIGESQHGYRTDESLREMLSEARDLDSYTSANILIELMRQASLKGRYREALKIAVEARKLVRVIRHKRQQALFAVREAYAHFRLGSLAKALEILEPFEKKLDRRDRALLVQVKGLKYMILESKESASGARAKGLSRLQSEITTLAHEVRNRRSLMFIRRWADSERSGVPVVLEGSPSPAEHWIDGTQDLHIRLELLERGYLAYFETLFSQPVENAILLSIVPGQVLFRTRRELSSASDQFSSVIRRGLLILAKGRCSKSELVELVWGYQYEASRHDTLIYTFISRLRSALGPLASLLTYSKDDESYGFERPVAVQVLEFQDLQTEAPAATSGVLEAESVGGALNLRQLEVLARLRAAWRDGKGPLASSVAAHELIEKYNVSRITATRDLAEMAELGHLIRTGSGRGTRYVLKNGITGGRL